MRKKCRFCDHRAEDWESLKRHIKDSHSEQFHKVQVWLARTVEPKIAEAAAVASETSPASDSLPAEGLASEASHAETDQAGTWKPAEVAFLAERPPREIVHWLAGALDQAKEGL
jgi:hypothetical protein